MLITNLLLLSFLAIISVNSNCDFWTFYIFSYFAKAQSPQGHRRQSRNSEETWKADPFYSREWNKIHKVQGYKAYNEVKIQTLWAHFSSENCYSKFTSVSGLLWELRLSLPRPTFATASSTLRNGNWATTDLTTTTKWTRKSWWMSSSTKKSTEPEGAKSLLFHHSRRNQQPRLRSPKLPLTGLKICCWWIATTMTTIPAKRTEPKSKFLKVTCSISIVIQYIRKVNKTCSEVVKRGFTIHCIHLL